MTRLYLIAISVLLALSGILGFFVYKGAVAKGALVEQNKALTDGAKRAAERLIADRKVLVARQAALASQSRILAQQNQELLNALQANKSWSDTNVPTEVQEALGGVMPAVPDGL